MQRVSLLDLDNVLLFLFLRNHGLDLSLLRLLLIAGKPSLFFLPLSPRLFSQSLPSQFDFSLDILTFRRISSDEARQAVSSWLSTVSPQPDDEVPPTPRLVERKVEKEKEESKRKRSKSMSKVKEEKEVGKGDKRGKKKGEDGEQANEQADEEKKGVTIAKLGPFKMSMELKGSGKPEKVETEKQTKAVRSRSRSRPSEERVRRKTSKLEEEKEQVVKEEAKEVEKETKKVDSNRRRKDKIVVSKMARSDRPLREKSPDKTRTMRDEEGDDRRLPKEKSDGEEEDYRASLNRKREKFTRSVSQPGPPPSLDFLLPAVTNKSFGKGAVTSSKLGSGGSQKIASGSRTDSFEGSGPALRRSNTLQEEVMLLSGLIDSSFKFSSTMVEVIVFQTFVVLQVVGERNVGTVYDNLGFDCRYSIFISVDSIFLNVVMSSEYSNI